KVASVPGPRAFIQQLPTTPIGGQRPKSQYQSTLQGTNTAELYRAAQDFEQQLRAVRGLADVTTDLQLQSPQVNVVIDRDKASALGVTADQIENALYDAYGDRWISTIYVPTNQYRVIIELEERWQLAPAALTLLYVRVTK